MVLRPQASLTSCAHVKDGISATFELTFFERCWSMAVGREGGPCD
jgi:hypothetical protein